MPARQLSLFESVEGAPHSLVFVRTVPDGYVSLCACGWQSELRRVKALAIHLHSLHLVDTPARRRAVEIVRVAGRWSHE